MRLLFASSFCHQGMKNKLIASSESLKTILKAKPCESFDNLPGKEQTGETERPNHRTALFQGSGTQVPALKGFRGDLWLSRADGSQV